MSQSFRMKHKNQKFKRVIRSQTTMIKTSTPKTGVAFRRSANISLSDIDSGSSSSGSRENISGIIKVGNQEKSLRKKEKKKSITEVLSSTRSTKSTNEWETMEEEIVMSSANSQESTPKKHNNTQRIKLFEDPCTPEMTRERPTAFESLYESPIIGPNRLYLEKDIVQRDNLLPIDLPPLEKRDRPEEMDEDEVVLHRDSNVKTYLSAEEAWKRRDLQQYQSVKEFWSDYWGNLMPDYKYEFLYRSYEAPSFPRYDHTRILCRDLDPKTLKPKDESKVESEEDDPIPPGMMRVRGSLDRNARRSKRTYKYGPGVNKRKWIDERNRKEQSGKRKRKEKAQSNDIYSEYDESDVEFKTAGPHGKRMTLSQFRQKRRMNKFVASSST